MPVAVAVAVAVAAAVLPAAAALAPVPPGTVLVSLPSYADWHGARHAPTGDEPTVDDTTDYTFASGADRAARWNPCDYIDYKITLDKAPRDGFNHLVEAVTKAEAATGLRFRYQGLSQFVPTDAEGWTEPGVDLTLAWVDRANTDMFVDGTTAIGYGGGGYRPATAPDGRNGWVMTSGMAVLESSFPRKDDAWLDDVAVKMGPRAAADVSELMRQHRRKVAMHEVGHALGLGHALGQAQIMSPGGHRAAEWGSGDRAGLHAVGASQPCLAVTATQAAAGRVPVRVAGPALLPDAWPVYAPGAPPVAAPPVPAPPVAAAPPAAPPSAPLPAAPPAARPPAAAPPAAAPPVQAPPKRVAPPKPAAPTAAGPAKVKRGKAVVLRVTGQPGAAFSVWTRAAGQKSFRRSRTGTLDARGTATVSFVVTKDHRWYAQVGKTRTAVRLTKVVR